MAVRAQVAAPASAHSMPADRAGSMLETTWHSKLLLGARVGWGTQDRVRCWHSSAHTQRSQWQHRHLHRTQPAARHLPNMNRAGVEAKVAVRAMPPAMVLVTLPPSRNAPRNSKMPARVMADHSLRVLEPTEVPEGGAAGISMVSSCSSCSRWYDAGCGRLLVQG